MLKVAGMRVKELEVIKLMCGNDNEEGEMYGNGVIFELTKQDWHVLLGVPEYKEMKKEAMIGKGNGNNKINNGLHNCQFGSQGGK